MRKGMFLKYSGDTWKIPSSTQYLVLSFVLSTSAAVSSLLHFLNSGPSAWVTLWGGVVLLARLKHKEKSSLQWCTGSPVYHQLHVAPHEYGHRSHTDYSGTGSSEPEPNLQECTEGIHPADSVGLCFSPPAASTFHSIALLSRGTRVVSI